MEELIFIALLVFFSIAESIARRRKASRAGGVGGPATTVEADADVFSPPWEVEELPTYDDDVPYDEVPSYDDLVEEEPVAGGARPEYTRPYGRGEGPPRDRAIPGRAHEPHESRRPPQTAAELLAELAGLATAPPRAPARPRPAPRQSPPLPVRTREPLHEVHRAHAHFGTDPSTRPPSEQDGLDPLARRLGADAAAIRAQLKGGDRAALRRAIMLREVLEPPPGLR